MKSKQEIVDNWLPRYTGAGLEQFGKYILLTNFSHYVNMFAQKQLDDYTDVVIQVAWSCVGTDGTYYSSSPGLTRLTFTAPDPNFTPYDQLTEEQVLAWIWGPGGVDQLQVQENINAEIELQANPPIVVLPLPWPN